MGRHLITPFGRRGRGLVPNVRMSSGHWRRHKQQRRRAATADRPGTGKPLSLSATLQARRARSRTLTLASVAAIQEPPCIPAGIIAKPQTLVCSRLCAVPRVGGLAMTSVFA